MSDELDRQRGIDAEGQRAATNHANRKGGASPPSRRGGRILGINSEGRPVDNVNASNRYDVDPRQPWLLIHCMSEDMETVLYAVYIPNTRERPDIVMYEGQPFEVRNTNLPVPQYRACMVAQAISQIEHMEKFP